MAIIPPGEVTGLILAGGASSRFGADKAAALLDGRNFLQRVASALAPHVTEVLVAVGMRPGGGRPGLPASRLREVEDLRSGAGPLAGLEAGFAVATTPVVFVVACDYPLLAPADVARVLAALGGQTALAGINVSMPLVAGRVHPLCAAWRREEASGALAAWLAGGRRDVTGFARSIGAVEVPIDPADETGYTNVNTPAELAGLAGLAHLPHLPHVVDAIETARKTSAGETDQ